MLRNVYNVRVKVFGTDKALDQKQADQMNLMELFKLINDKIQTN